MRISDELIENVTKAEGLLTDLKKSPTGDPKSAKAKMDKWQKLAFCIQGARYEHTKIEPKADKSRDRFVWESIGVRIGALESGITSVQL